MAATELQKPSPIYRLTCSSAAQRISLNLKSLLIILNITKNLPIESAVYMIHRVSMPGLEPMATRSQPQAQGVVYELVYIIKNNGPDAKWHGGVAKCCSRAAKCYGLPSH